MCVFCLKTLFNTYCWFISFDLRAHSTITHAGMKFIWRTFSPSIASQPLALGTRRPSLALSKPQHHARGHLPQQNTCKELRDAKARALRRPWKGHVLTPWEQDLKAEPCLDQPQGVSLRRLRCSLTLSMSWRVCESPVSIVCRVTNTF